MDRTEKAELSLALARLARGDRSAQRAVFELAWPLVLGFCRRLLIDPGDSEDAAQRAVIRMFEQASQYDVDRDGLTWALEIALWECRTVLRKRGRSRAEQLSAAALEVADGSLPADSVIERKEIDAALTEVLGAVSELDRQALLDGLSGVTWRKRRQRALSRLKLLWSTRYE